MEKAKKIITEGQRIREGLIDKLKINDDDYNPAIFYKIADKINEIIDKLNKKGCD